MNELGQGASLFCYGGVANLMQFEPSPGPGLGLVDLPRNEVQRYRRMAIRWSTPADTMEKDALVADGVLVYLSQWGTMSIGLAVQCPDGRYFGSIRAWAQVYDHVVEFLNRNQGRKLREGSRD